jgi:hypothetical protein
MTVIETHLMQSNESKCRAKSRKTIYAASRKAIQKSIVLDCLIAGAVQ